MRVNDVILFKGGMEEYIGSYQSGSIALTCVFFTNPRSMNRPSSGNTHLSLSLAKGVVLPREFLYA